MSDTDQAQPAVDDPIRIRVDVKDEAVVREYEEKYYGTPDRARTFHTSPAKSKRMTISGMSVTQDERNWAALAHGSAIITSTRQMKKLWT